MTTKQVITRSRQEIKQLESHAEHTIRTAHQHLLDALKPQLQALYDEIQAEQQRRKEADEDGKIPLSWLHEGNRLDAIKRAVTGQVNHFATAAHTTVVHVEHQATAMGKQAGREQVQAVKSNKES